MQSSHQNYSVLVDLRGDREKEKAMTQDDDEVTGFSSAADIRRAVKQNKTDPSLHSQASEEAVRAALFTSNSKVCEHIPANWLPDESPYYGHECVECVTEFVDHVSRERTRQTLERAAAIADNTTMGTPDGAQALKYKIEAAQSIAARIRALLSDGESVASEEKEE